MDNKGSRICFTNLEEKVNTRIYTVQIGPFPYTPHYEDMPTSLPTEKRSIIDKLRDFVRPKSPPSQEK